MSEEDVRPAEVQELTHTPLNGKVGTRGPGNDTLACQGLLVKPTKLFGLTDLMFEQRLIWKFNWKLRTSCC